MVGEGDDGLVFGFVADLGSTEDDFEVRAEAFQCGNDFEGWIGIPDINAEADDFRVLGEKDFGDVERALIDIELDESGAGLERAEVGKEVAEAERGVDVFGVKGGEDDIGHWTGWESSRMRGGEQLQDLAVSTWRSATMRSGTLGWGGEQGA